MFLTQRCTGFRFSRKSATTLQVIRLKHESDEMMHYLHSYLTGEGESWTAVSTEHIVKTHHTLYRWWTMNACSATDRTYIAWGAVGSWPLDLWPWWRSAGHRTHATVSSLIHNDVSMQSHTHDVIKKHPTATGIDERLCTSDIIIYSEQQNFT